MSAKQLLVMASAVGMIGLGVPLAQANSISLDTYAGPGSGWDVTRVLVGGGGEVPGGTVAAPVVEVGSPPGGWTTSGLDPAKWVSWDASTGDGYTGDKNGTSYIYTKAFTLGDFAGPAQLTLDGIMAFDNYVTSVELYDVTNSASVSVSLTPVSTYPVIPGNPTEFGYVYELHATSSTGFTSPVSFLLTVKGVNSYADSANLLAGTDPGPTGFIFHGFASADPLGGGGNPVPLPASVGVGFSMLAGFGGMFAARKRLSRRSRIA